MGGAALLPSGAAAFLVGAAALVEPTPRLLRQRLAQAGARGILPGRRTLPGRRLRGLRFPRGCRLAVPGGGLGRLPTGPPLLTATLPFLPGPLLVGAGLVAVLGSLLAIGALVGSAPLLAGLLPGPGLFLSGGLLGTSPLVTGLGAVISALLTRRQPTTSGAALAVSGTAALGSVGLALILRRPLSVSRLAAVVLGLLGPRPLVVGRLLPLALRLVLLAALVVGGLLLLAALVLVGLRGGGLLVRLAPVQLAGAPAIRAGGRALAPALVRTTGAGLTGGSARLTAAGSAAGGLAASARGGRLERAGVGLALRRFLLGLRQHPGLAQFVLRLEKADLPLGRGFQAGDFRLDHGLFMRGLGRHVCVGAGDAVFQPIPDPLRQRTARIVIGFRFLTGFFGPEFL
ncbi:hypothetical protein C6N75_08490 [Streptomyces solincola]|uniref:Uncharacterized protein n=1 Tax=Streptomyces solincola TaxID=2100817 RepID=A0A2S9PZ06_9ACTN|nr:hypothetical protein C6N75_08490 [Streptomyces solincola]